MNCPEQPRHYLFRSYYAFILQFTLIFSMSLTHSAVIQPDMILNILVKNDEFLTKQVKVQPNGTIDYPLYQDTPVVGMATAELQDILTLKLANYSDAPFVLVTVLKEMPITVRVMGQVLKPGPVSVSPHASLQEILLQAGGPTQFANFSKIKVLRKDETDEEASYYDLARFLKTGNVSLLPKIVNDDRIIVLSSARVNKIKVLGAVAKPGYYDAQDSATVFDMIYLAGGPAKDANLTKIRVMSRVSDQQTDSYVNLHEYIDKGKMDDVPVVSQGDVLIVYQHTFTWAKVLVVVRDVALLATSWIVIQSVVTK